LSDLESVYVIGRLGITAADGVDLDEDPDTIWCDGGSVRFTPLNGVTKVAGGSPVPWMAGHSTMDPVMDSSGFLSWSGVRRMRFIDLTSTTVNPRIADGKATHSVEFRNVTAGGVKVSFPATTVRIAADTAVPLTSQAAADALGLPLGTMVCDITILSPVPAAGGTPIVVGPAGPKGDKGDPGPVTASGVASTLSDPLVDTPIKAKIAATAAPLSSGRSDVRLFGAIGDFVSHPLSERFSTLAAAQAVYPRASSLGDTIDWCAIQTCLDQTGGAYLSPDPVTGSANYVVNRPIRLDDTTAGRALWGDNNTANQIISTSTTGAIVMLGNRGGIRIQNVGIGYSGTTARTNTGCVNVWFGGTFNQSCQFVAVRTFNGYQHWGQEGGAGGAAAVYSCSWRDCEASLWSGIAFDISTAFGMTSNRVDNFYAHNNTAGGGHSATPGVATIGGFRARGWQAGSIDNLNIEHCDAPFMAEIDSMPGSSIRSLYIENCQVTADSSAFVLVSANNATNVPVHGNLVVMEGLTISYSRFLSGSAPTAVGIVKVADGAQLDLRSLVEHDNTVTAPNAFLVYGSGTTAAVQVGQVQTAGALAAPSFSPSSQVKRYGDSWSVVNTIAQAHGCPFTAGLYYPPMATNATTWQFSGNGIGRGGTIIAGRDVTLTKIGIEVTTAGATGSVIRLGIYKISPGTGAASLLVDAGTIDGTSATYQELTISAAVKAGDVLIPFAASQGAAATQPTVRGSTTGWNPFTIGNSTATAASQNVTLGTAATSLTGALPGTHTLSGTTTIPRVMLRA
jgi:hypothetical protein